MVPPGPAPSFPSRYSSIQMPPAVCPLLLMGPNPRTCLLQWRRGYGWTQIDSLDAAGVGARPSIHACVHAYIYTQREACRPKNTPGVVQCDAHRVFPQHQSPSSKLLLQRKHIDIRIYRPKGATMLLRELGAHQYVCEEGLIRQLVNMDKPPQDPAKGAGVTELPSVSLSRVPLF